MQKSHLRPIVLDIDGVLAEWMAPFHKLLEAGDPNIAPLGLDGPTQWSWFVAHGASQAVIDAAYAGTTPKWYARLPSHKEFCFESQRLVERLAAAHPVAFVTARPHGLRATTEKWLSQRLTALTHPNVIITPSRKIMALIAMEPSVIVEDRPQTLADYAAAERDYKLPPCLKILVKRPYNQSWWNSPAMASVNSTYEALLLAENVLKGE